MPDFCAEIINGLISRIQISLSTKNINKFSDYKWQSKFYVNSMRVIASPPNLGSAPDIFLMNGTFRK